MYACSDIYRRSSYRDGPVAQAVDVAVNDNNAIYFNSAGNDGLGLRFDTVRCVD